MLLDVQIPFDQEWYRMLLVAQIPLIMTDSVIQKVVSGTNVTNQEWKRMLIVAHISLAKTGTECC